MQPELTESVFDYTYDPFVRRRRDMLPWWIKVGCWFFLITGILSAFIYPIAILLQGNLWFYIIDVHFLLSWAAVFDFCDGMLKMVIAYGLLKEKDWAIKLGFVQGSFRVR